MTLHGIRPPIGLLILLPLGAAPMASAAVPVAVPTMQAVDTIVKQAGPPVYPRGGTLVPELSIGTAAGAQEYMFGDVGDVLQLRDGSMLVVDPRSFAIRHYDAKGTYVRTLGRRGQGPGEYTRPGMLGELRDGRILLVDGGNARVNVYSASGESVGTWSLKSSGGTVASSRLTVDTTGTAVASIYASGGGIVAGSRLLRFAPDGRVVDTILAPTFSYTPPMAEVSTRAASVGAVIPFFPRTFSVWSPLGYLVTGVPTRYAVELRVPRPRPPSAPAAIPAMGYRGPTPPWTNEPIVSIRHSAPPVSISDEQRSVERMNVEAIVRNVDPTWRYSGPDIPRIKPPYRDLRVGDDGTIWVQLSMPGERYMPDAAPSGAAPSSPILPRWREPAVYDVFESDGRYLGRVTRDNNVRLIRMTRSHVWAAVADEDDVAIVKRFRIDWR